MAITHDLATTGTKSCTVICRELVKAGADPETLIEFVRRSAEPGTGVDRSAGGTTPVFASKPIQWWSDRRVREADNSGPMRFTTYRPGSDPE